MNCKQVGEDLLDLASGNLPAPEVAEHVRACAECGKRLAELQSTMSLLDEWQAPEPSPYFNARLRARLREQAGRPRGWLEWVRKPALALTMAALMIAAVGLFRGGRDLNHNGAAVVASQQPAQTRAASAAEGTAVSDLQTLDKNTDLLADFDLLDEIEPSQEINR